MEGEIPSWIWNRKEGTGEGGKNDGYGGEEAGHRVGKVEGQGEEEERTGGGSGPGSRADSPWPAASSCAQEAWVGGSGL